MNLRPSRSLGVLFVFATALSLAYGDDGNSNAVVFWNRILLQCVVDTRSAPTVTARALAMVHTSIFDAWSAYDPFAVTVEKDAPRHRPEPEWTKANKKNCGFFRSLSNTP